MDSGLYGVRGAQQIIAMINARPAVTRLILGHNELSDDGCVALFQFLNTKPGRAHQITEISLNSNCIGDRGLVAIAAYLNGNKHLQELFLQNNEFGKNPATVSLFAKALNKSQLRLLALATNRNLGDAFVSTFFPVLAAPALREIHLSATGLTRTSAAELATFLRSCRCRLHTLKCGGNSLGYRGVRKMLLAIEKGNFYITTMDVYSNQLANRESDSEDEANRDRGSDNDDDNPLPRHPIVNFDAWKGVELQLRSLMTRNVQSKLQVAREACELLRCARAVLLHRNPPDNGLQNLPNELQLHILSFIAPTLSPAQRYRICTYSAYFGTLPSLFPSHSRQRISDSSALPLSDIGNARRRLWDATGEPATPLGGVCPQGQCLGKHSLNCGRYHARQEWLERIGCAAYDPAAQLGEL